MTSGSAAPGQDATSPLTDLEWKRPSPQIARLRGVQLACLFIPLLVVALAAGAGGGGGVGLAIGGGAAVVLAIAAAVFVQRRARAWGYAERDEDLLVRRGVMFRRLSIIPYGRMQYVDVTAGPFERMFGLATVKMHTAAAASDARIPALEAGEAGRLRDTLARLGEARASGL